MVSQGVLFAGDNFVPGTVLIDWVHSAAQNLSLDRNSLSFSFVIQAGLEEQFSSGRAAGIAV